MVFKLISAVLSFRLPPAFARAGHVCDFYQLILLR